MLFTPESLDHLRQRVDLVELLSSHIDLKRAGASYKALCPFHDEKSPSFVIKPGDKHYHCFGCGAHGDAIHFLMNHQKLSFMEAVESLAERFNVVLEKMEKGESTGPSKKLLKEALAHATQFFHFFLLYSIEGQRALRYLYERGIDLSFIKQFQIGFAPQNGELLRKFLHEKRISNDIQREVGLLSKEGGRPFFRDRITFPIHSAQNAVIGYSARKYREETFGGKYVNTPETPLFKKSRTLFGLNYSRQRIAKEKRAIIVEGQVDALRLIHMGLNCTVAAQGTAFGTGHVQELANLGLEKVYLALDSDEAGREATCKVGQLFQKEGIEVNCVPLPVGADPDSLLIDEGLEAFMSLLKKSDDYLTFLVSHRMRHVDPNSPAAKNAVVTQLVQQIRGWESSVMVHESLRKLAQLTNIPETALGIGQVAAPNVLIQQRARVGSLAVNPDRVLESDLLRWLLMCGEEMPTLVRLVEANLRPEDLREPLCRELLDLYLDSFEGGESCDALGLLSKSENPQLQDLIGEILTRRINQERAELHLHETVQKLLDRNWMLQREAVKAKIHSGSLSDEEALSLAAEFSQLQKNPPLVSVPEESES